MLRVSALPNVPRWAVIAAHAVPLVTLPSGLWRIALVAGVPVVSDDSVDTGWGWTSVYIISLSLVSEALAFLTLGLVRHWGEVVPRRIPLLGGREVRPLAAVGPALAGALCLFALVGWNFYAQHAGLGEGLAQSTPHLAQKVTLYACYAPLPAWPPLLVAVTVAYYRRRVPSRRATHPQLAA